MNADQTGIGEWLCFGNDASQKDGVYSIEIAPDGDGYVAIAFEDGSEVFKSSRRHTRKKALLELNHKIEQEEG